MNEINIMAVLASAIACFVFGALWYSPILFLKRWCKETTVDLNKSITNPGKVYGITFILTLLAAFAFAWLLGPKPDLPVAIFSGALAGIGMVAASMGINYQFANCSLTHWLIDSGFHICRFVIMGVILGLWH